MVGVVGSSPIVPTNFFVADVLFTIELAFLKKKEAFIVSMLFASSQFYALLAIQKPVL